ncbi:MAG: diguanylate cyclase [Clostridia bacterium]|nr:diguanylate cyclase [Clostridia bacterium]
MKVRFTLESKLYVFITAVVLFAAIGVVMLSYNINANQLERFDKRITKDSAKNYATLTDVEYLSKLKTVVLSDEYQKLRERAERQNDEELVINYLKEKGLWEQYQIERNKMKSYEDNLSDIKYLYIVVWGDEDSKYNMYLLDSDDVPVYETGLYEEREEEFLGVDAHEEVEPTISNGIWGFLCSAYAPVYDSKGELVCTVGCDLDMADVARGRRVYFLYLMVATIILIVIILVSAVKFVHTTVVSPITRLTEGMKKFNPEEGLKYEEAGVIEVNVKSNDEIKDIYEETRSMQIRIIDYIDSITQIRKEKERVEDVVRSKEQEIGAISKKAYRDSLTDVGNKEAYTDKMRELDEGISEGKTEFAIVMLDINILKTVNDTYGHKAGDLYIKGCCGIFSEAFNNSPIYRIGGDEFVAVLTAEDYQNRFTKLDTMSKKFARTEKDNSVDPWLRFSASAGMAEFTPEDKTAEAVFERADRLMYENKQRHKKGR